MRQSRRQLLSRSLGLFPALGIAGLLGCKQPVAPEGRASAPSRSTRPVAIMPTPTGEVGGPRRLGMLGAGQLGWQCDRIRETLRKLGYTINWQYAYLGVAELSQLGTLPSKLIARDVEVLVVNGPTSALAASQVTQRVPIVMALGAYPVETGLVQDLVRPGRNVTGVFVEAAPLVAKRLALLQDMLPTLARLAVLTNPAGSTSAWAWSDIQSAAVTAGIQVHEVQATSVAELGAAFTAAVNGGDEAVWVVDDELFDLARQSIIFQAESRKIPVLYGRREFVEEGGLISFGSEIESVGQLAGALVDRILRGEPAGALPLEEANRFEAVINLNAAQSLGLTFPASMTSQASHVVPLGP